MNVAVFNVRVVKRATHKRDAERVVEIFRGDRYLGRAEIMRADPDRAVGRILREFQQGQIQENDDVATKLRVG